MDNTGRLLSVAKSQAEQIATSLIAADDDR
jgi:hypothetical protein